MSTDKWWRQPLDDLLAGAVVSKFATSRECRAYRDAVKDCMEAIWNAEPMATRSAERDTAFLRHCASVMKSVIAHCEPKARKDYDDPTEYHGGLALDELQRCADQLDVLTSKPNAIAPTVEAGPSLEFCNGTVEQPLDTPSHVASISGDISLKLAEHGIDPAWYLEAKRIAARILDYEWQSQGDRQATMVANISFAIKEAVEKATPSSTRRTCPHGRSNCIPEKCLGCFAPSAKKEHPRTAYILLAWEAAALSEGQVAKALGVDRVTAREMKEAAVREGVKALE